MFIVIKESMISPTLASPLIIVIYLYVLILNPDRAYGVIGSVFSGVNL